MPPNGLYSIPRHHLSGSTFLSRPTYSALDLAEEEAKKMAVIDSTSKDSVTEAIKKAEKRKSKKKHKKHREDQDCDGGATITVAGKDTAAAQGQPTVSCNTSDAIVKHRKRDKKSKEAGHVSSSSKKKRKRDSDTTVFTPLPVPGEAGASGNHNGQEQRISKKKSKPTLRNGDADLAAINKLLTPYEQLQLKPHEGLERKLKNSAGDFGSQKKKPKKSKKITGNVPREIQKLSERAPKTPIPLPPPYRNSASSSIQKQPRKQPKEYVASSEVIVPETPPSFATQRHGFHRKTPIPFPMSSSSKPPATAPNLSGMGLLTPAPTSSSPIMEMMPPNSAQSTIAVPQLNHHRSDVSSQPTPVADARITQPLLDQPKPRPVPRSSRASSVTSTSSRASSISIPEMFNRIGMPHARSGARIDPFIARETKTKPRETHDDSSMNEFDTKFGGLLLAVNFSVEQEYLNQYHDWHTENDSEYPFPCLGKGSGCTPKKEDMLHLSKREDIDNLKTLEIAGGDKKDLQDAKERAKQAEEFLALAVRARLPVPVGRLEGMWTLYCPQYSEHHFDRYGYGMRTLTISRIAGFKDVNSYVGRLSIPPRSMGYSILTFQVPPHASFRTVTITTAHERYTMDVVFLGNGYLHLRVDLQLLLKGKPAELVGGKKAYMEFVGVHEKAVQWVEKKDGVEEVERKLFSTYEGMGSE